MQPVAAQILGARRQAVVGGWRACAAGVAVSLPGDALKPAIVLDMAFVREQRRLPVVLSPDEVARLLDAAASPLLERIAFVLTGWRACYLCYVCYLCYLGLSMADF
jgi:hypothetical protein